MVSFQVESFVLRGPDETADSIGRFALVLLAAAEGRPWPPFDAPGRRRPTARAGAAKRATASGPKAAPSTSRRAAAANPKLPALPARTATGRTGRGSQA